MTSAVRAARDAGFSDEEIMRIFDLTHAEVRAILQAH